MGMDITESSHSQILSDSEDNSFVLEPHEADVINIEVENIDDGHDHLSHEQQLNFVDINNQVRLILVFHC